MNAHELDLNMDQFELFQAGDEKVFKLVFDRYHKILFRYSNAILKDVEKSEELVHTAFIQLFKYKSRIVGPSELYPYIFVTTKRLLARTFRDKVQLLHAQFDQGYNFDIPCDKTEQEIQSRDLKGILNKLIDQLPQKQSEIYRLSKIQGYSYDEISSMTGSSRNTIKNQLISASKKIKSSIEKFYFLIIYFFFF
ncbi:sigma-70 family RNA polymerase sigma factor [Sphingobacterium sp. DK4209]|uniref:Sigma-70 family RNA polymerase sigma factor n=1 Tax=Sphingobacterium zhuxiongii TaxID=2662364 RepID=A0A5Q0QE56_9SPHI|nr:MULTISPECIES: RNA polymerase sigma factor [unclassified Sphingobacterium]MVZ66499.1 sigma-70 family RNA polymerase sigma factor [Sphingobacterium sp. DK4209]QGA27846.1 sigma-70 family RNA polymerase sigma factor [Sphingobacterium sp. dk4302]